MEQQSWSTRRELRRAGVSARREKRQVDAGVWSRPIPGIVAAGRCEGTELVAAALARGGPDALLCARTAALVMLERPFDGLVHVLTRHGTRVRPAAGVVFHQSRSVPTPHTVSGWPVTSPARTAAGIAAGDDPECDRRALVTELVREGWLTPDELAAAAARTPRRRRGQVVRLVEEVLAGALSGPEAMLWRGQVEARMPVPVLNAPVRAAGRGRALDGLLEPLRAGYEVHGAAHHAGTWAADMARAADILVELGIVELPIAVGEIELDLPGVLRTLARFWANRAAELGVTVPPFEPPPRWRPRPAPGRS